MKKSTTKQTIRLYWNYMRRYPRKIIGVGISMPLVVLFYNFLPPLILANALDRLATGQFQPNQVWDSFGVSLVAYAVILFIGGAVGWRVIDYFNWRLEASVQRDIAQSVYNHLLLQDANFHANNFSGSLVSQANKFLGAYIRFADTTMYQVVPLGLSVLFTCFILAGRAPLFVVVLVAGVALYVAVSIFVTKKVRKYSAEHADAESAQTGYLADSITNIMAIKGFAGSNYERKQFAEATDTTHRHLLRVMRASQKQMFVFSSLTSSILALSLVMAVIGVMIFNANIATVFLILNYTASIAAQLFTFSNNSLRNYNRAFGDASGMTEVLGITPSIQDPVKPQKSRIHRGSIDLSNVVFTHDGMNGALFQNLNLRIKPGEKVGLVGRSGSGKTTLTKLLLRFSDISGGEILIDGQNVAKLRQDDLRRSIAYVPQEPIMFHRSLMENIRYGQLGASQKAAVAASKMAHAHEFIKDLPQGYETLVGERGVKLSGGQRQRVAIARAMLKNAPILVLDEATSALDSESEVLIQDALWKLMEGRTTIIIAHRLSTIRKMDRIIVLDQGQIVEQGSHNELIRQKGGYADLWAHQNGDFLKES